MKVTPKAMSRSATRGRRGGRSRSPAFLLWSASGGVEGFKDAVILLKGCGAADGVAARATHVLPGLPLETRTEAHTGSWRLSRRPERGARSGARRLRIFPSTFRGREKRTLIVSADGWRRNEARASAQATVHTPLQRRAKCSRSPRAWSSPPADVGFPVRQCQSGPTRPPAGPPKRPLNSNELQTGDALSVHGLLAVPGQQRPLPPIRARGRPPRRRSGDSASHGCPDGP